jgi:hypothetical protein
MPDNLQCNKGGWGVTTWSCYISNNQCQFYSMSYTGNYETNMASFKAITLENSPSTFISAIFKKKKTSVHGHVAQLCTGCRYNCIIFVRTHNLTTCNGVLKDKNSNMKITENSYSLLFRSTVMQLGKKPQ